jgi:lipopolysaccharide transport system permease protein
MAQPSPSPSPASDDFDLVIEGGQSWRRYTRELWKFRGLFLFLTWRDVLVLYKQTAIGVVWVLIRPLLTMCVFTLIFGRLAGLPSQGVPYALLVFAGMIPWQMFASALSESSASLLTNAHLVTKVYFPRVVVPASAVAATVVDLGISTLLLLVMMLSFQVAPTWRLGALPFFALLGLSLAFGAGLWFSALSVKYRDFRYVVPFAVQLGLYVSPVGFSAAIVPERWRSLYALNPMVGVIEGFRWAVTGGVTALSPQSLLTSAAITVGLCTSGFLYFRRVERTFADVI